jgi:hypothetical protein
LSEKNQLKDWFETEEQFLDLKHLFEGVAAYKSSVNNEKNTRKKELDELFAHVHASKSKFDWKGFFFPTIKPFFLQPGFQMGFGILVIAVLSLVFTNQVSKTTVVATQKKFKKETVKESKTINKQEQAKEQIENQIQIQLASIELKNSKNELIVEQNESVILGNSLTFSSELDAETTMNLGNFAFSNANINQFDYLKKQEANDQVIPTIAPVSSRPEILDLLFTTY